MINYEYTERLRRALKIKGYEIVEVDPLTSLWLFVNRYVDAALVSSVASSVLMLEPLWEAPAVISKGKVENVILMVRNFSKDNLKLWISPVSVTGASLAMWYLNSIKIKFVVVNRMDEADAILMIGDEARRLSSNFDGEVIDLGQAWYEEVGTPVVYALTTAWRPMVMSIQPYTWRNIMVVPFNAEVSEYFSIQNKILRDYWMKPVVPARGLLGMLLRSAK